MFAFVAQPGGHPPSSSSSVESAFSFSHPQHFGASLFESSGGIGAAGAYQPIRIGSGAASGLYTRPIMSASQNGSFVPHAQAFAPAARAGGAFVGSSQTSGDVRVVFAAKSPEGQQASRRASAIAPPQHLVHQFTPPQQSLPLLGADAVSAPVFSPFAREQRAAAVEGHVEVYAYNMEQSLREIDALATYGQHNFIALDTEFPGLVSPASETQSGYERVRDNVALTKLVQLGVSVFNADGLCAKTYQFNFRYSGPFNPASLQMLRDAGIDLDRNRAYGIDHRAFAAVFRSTSLLSNPSLVWVLFHGCFDAAYLLQTLTQQALPVDFAVYRQHQKILFPHIVDVKTLAIASLAYVGGLERLAASPSVNAGRVGVAHQAGSDSRLTGDVFFALLAKHPQAQASYFDCINNVHGFVEAQ